MGSQLGAHHLTLEGERGAGSCFLDFFSLLSKDALGNLSLRFLRQFEHRALSIRPNIPV